MLDNVDKERGETFVQGDVYDVRVLSFRHSRYIEDDRSKWPRRYPPRHQRFKDGYPMQKRMIQTRYVRGFIYTLVCETDVFRAAFLQINDQINNVMQRYEAFKRGDYEAGSNPVPPELACVPFFAVSTSSSLFSSDPAPSSLIDLLGDETEASANQATTGPEDELAGLFGPSSSQTGPTTNNTNASGGARPSTADIMSMFNASPPQPSQPMYGGGMAHPRPAMGYNTSFGGQPNMGMNAAYQQQALFQATPQQQQQQQQQQGYQTPTRGPIMLPGTPQSQHRVNASGSRSGTPSLGLQPNTLGRTASMGGSTSTPIPALAPAPVPATMATTTTAQGKPKDPFADLAGLF